MEALDVATVDEESDVALAQAPSSERPRESISTRNGWSCFVCVLFLCELLRFAQWISL